ncbi:siderophore-interacting protein [Pseudoalteromonas denitrificans]|uniref:NADPH-dependent ferric siderophore reductase, contains FAD-binding and SIP domains n=1 Tax=Pseudoalteromonas denitrificans DSM 6059 TaxID=1123010 RepID=A0A1I1EL90_9GAMM|nr:siderophore-interacting protein [Pseudoalteromonas denitrificans]SFB87416.1 NADPH-dependent ferric siderophore reductase, contains FAD-binding and SIP domains [Pseudoalteromonas denitrificans DSM 6059]
MSEAPKRVPPRLLCLVRKHYISPNLLRVTLTGEALKGFPINKNGSHIKLFIPREGETKPSLPRLTAAGIEWPKNRPITRAYSVRKYHPDTNELDIDFVAHGKSSPASGWAVNANEGDFIGVAGPGGPDPLLAPADWHILAGDLTAVPAISAILETLDSKASGHVFIEVDNLVDKHFIAHPSGINIHWILRDVSRKKNALIEAINNVAPDIGVKSISAFIAGENASVIACRDKLRVDYQLTKKNLYAVPYWRRGQDEETYHEERHTIMDQVY